MSAEDPELDPFERRLLRQERRKRQAMRLLKILPIFILAFLFYKACWPMFESHERPVFHLSEAEKARLRARVEASKREAEQAEQVFAEAMQELESLVPRPDLGRCPVSLPLPVLKGYGYSPRPFSMSTISPGQASSLKSRLASTALFSLKGLEAAIDKGSHSKEPMRDFERRLRYPRALDRSRREVIFVQTFRLPGFVDALATSFTPGRVKGRAYLYDHGSGRVLCAGDVEAGNSVSVDFNYTRIRGGLDSFQARPAAQAALDADLEDRLYEAVASRLRYRAGPAPAPADAGTNSESVGVNH